MKGVRRESNPLLRVPQTRALPFGIIHHEVASPRVELGRRDGHQNLNLACLPIPPRGQESWGAWARTKTNGIKNRCAANYTTPHQQVTRNLNRVQDVLLRSPGAVSASWRIGCAPCGARNHDPLIKSQLLYQLS